MILIVETVVIINRFLSDKSKKEIELYGNNERK